MSVSYGGQSTYRGWSERETLNLGWPEVLLSNSTGQSLLPHCGPHTPPGGETQVQTQPGPHQGAAVPELQ